MADETCPRRITEMQQKEEREFSIPVSTVSSQDLKESSDTVVSTPRQENTGSTEAIFVFKKVRCSYAEDNFEINNNLSEGNKELGSACFVSGAEENQEKLDSAREKIIACDFTSGMFECDGKAKGFDLQKGEIVNYENLNDTEKGLLRGLVDKEDKDLMKVEMGFSATQERDKFKREKESIVEDDCKEIIATSFVDVINGFPMDEKLKSDTLLEEEKRRLLAALDLGKVFEDKTQMEKFTGLQSFPQIDEKTSDLEDVQKILQNDGETIDGIKLIDGSVRRSVKIEVIDDTALVESVLVPKTVNDSLEDARKEKKQEVDGKKAKRSRRKAKDTKMSSGMSAMLTNLKDIVEDGLNNGVDAKIMYSREEMEALRYVKTVEQEKMWRDIYAGLGTAVLKDYDNLASSKHRKQIFMNSDPRPCFSRRSQAPGIIGQDYFENMENEAEYTEDYEEENLNTMDSACSHRTEAYLVLEEECGEEYDSDEDYASIQRPAFLVEGEPNFDSGPPEDGLEYLRRVRWEAVHIPKVKVAKSGRQKSNKEQTVYMPQIPDIAPCPEHILPLKQWEDHFLADFSQLRLILSGHEYPSAQLAGKLQSRLINNKENDLRTDEVHSDQPLALKGSFDQSSVSNPKDDEISPSYQSPKAFQSDDSVDYPMLSAILRMDSVAQVSALKKRISSVETLNTLSRSDCLWLFALCAAVDSPVDADTSAALRSLLRKCASLRAAKFELDDEVVMLNILATISGKYFGQSERD